MLGGALRFIFYIFLCLMNLVAILKIYYIIDVIVAKIDECWLKKGVIGVLSSCC